MSASKRKSPARKAGSADRAAGASESKGKSLAVAGRSKPGDRVAARSGVSKTSTGERGGNTGSGAGSVTGAGEYPNAVYEDKRR